MQTLFYFGIAIAEESKKFEQQGFRVFNRSKVNIIANNKLRTFELAALLGVPAVPTREIGSANEIETFPVVLKTVDGYGGNEVFLCNEVNECEPFFKKFSTEN